MKQAVLWEHYCHHSNKENYCKQCCINTYLEEDFCDFWVSCGTPFWSWNIEDVLISMLTPKYGSHKVQKTLDFMFLKLMRLNALNRYYIKLKMYPSSMSCTINVNQSTEVSWCCFTSCWTLHTSFHCYWQQPSSCIHSTHLADTFPRHTSCTQKVTQPSYKHLSMPTGMSQKQTSGCSSATLLHSTKCVTQNMKTTASENYTSNPLLPSKQFPTEQQTLLWPISCIPSLLVNCLRYCWKYVCMWRTQSYAQATEMYLLHTVPVHFKPCIHQ